MPRHDITTKWQVGTNKPKNFENYQEGMTAQPWSGWQASKCWGASMTGQEGRQLNLRGQSAFRSGTARWCMAQMAPRSQGVAHPRQNMACTHFGSQFFGKTRLAWQNMVFCHLREQGECEIHHNDALWCFCLMEFNQIWVVDTRKSLDAGGMHRMVPGDTGMTLIPDGVGSTQIALGSTDSGGFLERHDMSDT